MLRKKRPLNNDGSSMNRRRASPSGRGGNTNPVKKHIIIRKKQKLSDTTRSRGSSPSGRGSSKGAKNGAKKREKTVKMEVEAGADEKTGPQPVKAKQAGTAVTPPNAPEPLFTGEDVELDERPLVSTKSSFKDLTYRSLIEIATFLDPIEITHLSLCSKLIHPLTRHSTIWSIHYRKTMSSIISAKAPRTNEWTMREKALWQFATSSKLRVRAKKREQKKAEAAASGEGEKEKGMKKPKTRQHPGELKFRIRNEIWSCLMRERRRRIDKIAIGKLNVATPPRFPKATNKELMEKAQQGQEKVVDLCAVRLAEEAESRAKNNAGGAGGGAVEELAMVDYTADRAAFDTEGGNKIMEELGRGPAMTS